ncbi:hypothetical protein VTN02DRAFT_2751 [Thermoascus thermophilus]
MESNMGLSVTARGAYPSAPEDVQIRPADPTVSDLDVDIGLFPGLGLELLPDHLALNSAAVEAHPSLELVVCLRHGGWDESSAVGRFSGVFRLLERCILSSTKGFAFFIYTTELPIPQPELCGPCISTVGTGPANVKRVKNFCSAISAVARRSFQTRVSMVCRSLRLKGITGRSEDELVKPAASRAWEGPHGLSANVVHIRDPRFGIEAGLEVQIPRLSPAFVLWWDCRLGTMVPSANSSSSENHSWRQAARQRSWMSAPHTSRYHGTDREDTFRYPRPGYSLSTLPQKSNAERPEVPRISGSKMLGRTVVSQLSAGRTMFIFRC